LAVWILFQKFPNFQTFVFLAFWIFCENKPYNGVVSWTFGNSSNRNAEKWRGNQISVDGLCVMMSVGLKNS
jgi:hypothetical protein